VASAAAAAGSGGGEILGIGISGTASKSESIGRMAATNVACADCGVLVSHQRRRGAASAAKASAGGEILESCRRGGAPGRAAAWRIEKNCSGLKSARRAGGGACRRACQAAAAWLRFAVAVVRRRRRVENAAGWRNADNAEARIARVGGGRA